MSTTTTNYGLIKPGTDDPILIGQLNDNADAIDAALKENADALGGKVDKETGKGLSTNDYTTAEKTKLAGIAEGAEVNEIEDIKVNNTTINPDANKVVNITVPTTAADVSALPDTTKYATALSLTINSSTFVMTGQLKDQNGDNLGIAQTIDLPLESVVVGGSYNSQTKKVVLTLQNGNTIEFSVADLVSGLQTELSASNKLNPAYINYDSTHRAVSDTEKSTWNGKQNALSSAQLDAVNSGITSEDVAQIKTNKNNISLLEQANGAKNLLDYTLASLKTLNTTGIWNDNVYTNNGVSYTINTDMTISIINISETHSYSALYLLSNFNFDNKIYSVTGAIGGAVQTVSIRVNSGNDTYVTADFGDGATFTGSSTKTYGCRIAVQENAAIETTFEPMICDKSIYEISHTYQPHAMTNVELTAAIRAIQAQLANQ